MPTTPTVSTFELATIHRLQALGYRYLHASTLDRPLHAVVLEGELRNYLGRRYAHLPAAAVEQAIRVISAPEGATLDWRNMTFQRLLREGYTLRYEAENPSGLDLEVNERSRGKRPEGFVRGEERHEHFYLLNPAAGAERLPGGQPAYRTGRWAGHPWHHPPARPGDLRQRPAAGGLRSKNGGSF